MPDSLTGQDQGEVIIYTAKLPVRKSDLLPQLGLIRRQEIAFSQPSNTANLIENSGQAFVQKSQAGGGSPVLRGFESNRIVLVVDGVRMNNPIYRSGHLQNILTVGPATLDRVEILNGSASTLYGSDALGGVISLFTRNPDLSDTAVFDIRGDAGIRFGSASLELSGHAALNIANQKFASLSLLTYSDFGDLRMGGSANPFYKRFGERSFYADRVQGRDTMLYNPDPLRQRSSGYRQYDLLQKFLFKQHVRLSHMLNLQFSNSGNIPRYDRLTEIREDKPRFAEWYYGPQTRVLSAYQLQYRDITDFIRKIDLNLNYQYISESRHNRNFGSDLLFNRTEYVQVAGYTLDITAMRHGHDLLFGLDGQSSWVISRAVSSNISNGAISSLDTRYPSGKNRMNSMAFYVVHQAHINSLLSLHDGFRIGYSGLYSVFADSTFYRFPVDEIRQDHLVVSGHAGVSFRISKYWDLKFLFHSGYRVPNIDDLAKVFESVPGKLIVPNPDIVPEKTFSGEVRLISHIGDKVQIEQSFWVTGFRDVLQAAPFLLAGNDSALYDGSTSAVYASQNLGSAFLLGYHADMQARIGKHVRFSAMLNYTYGRIRSDSGRLPLDHIPPLYGRIGCVYSISRFQAESYLLFNGWKRLGDYSDSGEDNLNYATPTGMPAWITWNIRLSWQAHENLIVLAGAENLLDRQYRTFASGINASGRNVYLALKLNW